MAKAATKKKARRFREEVEDRKVVPITKNSKNSKRNTSSIEDSHWQAQRLEPKTKAQSNYLQLIESQDLIFGVGPAGTGKSYVAVKWACQQLEQRRIAKIVVTRPAVEAEEQLGFLPGEIDDKFAPYFKPIRNIIEQHFGVSHTENMIKNGRIEIAPLAYIRGITIDNGFVILDEAQNTTVGQMKLLLTRIGENTKVVVDGDTDQVDIKVPSGLEDALKRFEGMEGCGIQRFTDDDIVRSKLVKNIIMRYRS